MSRNTTNRLESNPGHLHCIRRLQQIKVIGNGTLWKLFMHSIFWKSSIWIFLLIFFWYVDLFKVEISCSTSPPGGNQVDGLPPALNEEEVWTGSQTREAVTRGFKILGTPVETPKFVEVHEEKWTKKERKFWKLLTKLPDLQSTWLLLLNYASPRSTYCSRTVSPQKNSN